MRTSRNVSVIILLAVIVGCQDPDRGLTTQQTDRMLDVQKTLAAERTLVAAEHAAVGRARDALEN